MKKRKISYKQGFVALISSILISSILLGLALSTSSGAFSVRGNLLSREFKKMTVSLTESCIEDTILELSLNYSYSVENKNISIGEYVCTVVSIVHKPENESEHKKIVVITTQATIHSIWATLEVSVEIQNPSFVHEPTTQKIKFVSQKEI